MMHLPGLDALVIAAQVLALLTAWKFSRAWPLMAFLGVSSVQAVLRLWQPLTDDLAWCKGTWAPVEAVNVVLAAVVVCWVIRRETERLDRLTAFLVRFAATVLAGLFCLYLGLVVHQHGTGWLATFMMAREYVWCGLTFALAGVAAWGITQESGLSETFSFVAVWTVAHAVTAPMGRTHLADWLSARVAYQIVVSALCLAWSASLMVGAVSRGSGRLSGQHQAWRA